MSQIINYAAAGVKQANIQTKKPAPEHSTGFGGLALV